MADALPRFRQHVASRSRRFFKRRESGERLEEKHFGTLTAGQTLERRHHGFHSDACCRNEGHKEIRKTEVSAMDALFSDRKIGGKLLGDRRSIEVAGGDGLGAAIGLYARKEKIGAFAGPVAFQTKGRAICADFSAIGLAVGRE